MSDDEIEPTPRPPEEPAATFGRSEVENEDPIKTRMVRRFKMTPADIEAVSKELREEDVKDPRRGRRPRRKPGVGD
jgi:hypothetical protein